MTLEENLTEYGKFIEWLDGKGEKMTPCQNSVASMLFGLVRRGGKSWLIDRLYHFDRRLKSSEAGK